MADNIFTTGEEEIVSPFTIDPEVAAESLLGKQQLATYDAFIQNEVEGDYRLGENYLNSLSLDSTTIKNKITEEERQRKSESLSEVARGLIQGDTAVFHELAPEIPEVQNNIDQESLLSVAPELAVVDAMMPHVADPVMRERVANNLWFKRHIKEMMESAGALETVNNFAGLLFLTDESLDTSRVLGTGVEGFFNSAEGWKQYIQAFNTLEPEEQRETFLRLKGAIVEATDENELKSVIKLMELIDPTTDKSIDVSHALDKLAIVGGLLAAASTIRKVYKTTNLIKSAKMLGNETVAADLTSEAMNSPKVAAAIDMGELEVAASASPFNMGELIEGATDGVAAEVKLNFKTLDEFIDDNKFLQEGLGLTEQEQAASITRTRERLELNKDIDNIEVVKKSDLGFTLQYDKVGVGKVTDARSFTIDDVTGGFKAEGLSPVGTAIKLAASPNFLFKKDREALVNAFERIMFASDKIRAKFDSSLLQIVKPIKGNKESIKKVDDILLAGDEQSRVFSYKELVLQGVDGVRLSDKEFLVYANIRKMMDKAFLEKNREIRATLSSQGMKEVTIKGAPQILKPFTNKQAISSVNHSEFKTAFVEHPIGKDGDVVTLTADKLKDYYDNGYTLSRTADGAFYKIDGTRHSKYVLHKNSDVADLPSVILNKKAGYVPRKYEEGYYFVKTKRHGEVDGKNITVGLSTERFFNSKKEAEAFKQKLIDDGAVEDDVFVRHDRQMSGEDFDREVVGLHKGLYTGARKTDELLFGAEGTKGKRVTALDSVSDYFTHISSRIPMTRYRLGIMERWMNHAKESKAIGHDYKGGFEQAVDNLSKDTPPTVRAFLEKSHEQIQFQLRIPTLGEKELESTVRAMAESVEKRGWFGAKGPAVVKSLHRFDHKDPISAARAATFHTLLGVFSPAQFLVQMAGSTVALSLAPTKAPTAISRALRTAFLDNIHNPNALNLHMGKFNKQIKGEEGFSEFYEAWRTSGFNESVLQSHGDLYASAHSLPLGKLQMKTMLEKGLIFYKSGELFNRRMSFSVAFDLWKEKNKGAKVTDKGLKEITTEANKFLLHMSRANKAKWQKGALSIPTQFMQVHTKFIELIMGNQLSPGERFQLMLNQGVIFGAAGIPLMKTIGDNTMAALGLQPGDVDDKTLDFYRGGISQVLIRGMLGADVEVAKRGAIGLGIEESFINSWGKKDFAAKLLTGPAGGVASRAWKSVGQIYNITSTAFKSGEELPASVWASAADKLFDITTSWNNASKAYEAFNNKLLFDSKGNVAVDLHGTNMQTYIGMGMGFRHRDLENIFLSTMADSNNKERINNKVNSVVNTLNSLTLDLPDDESYRVSNIVIDSLLSSENQDTKNVILERVMSRLSDPTTKKDKAIRSRINDILRGVYSPSDISDPLVTEALGE